MSSKWKRKGGRKFIMLERWLLNSPAWRQLSTVERAAYVEFKYRYDGLNNGRISMSCREMADLLNVSKATAARAIHRLDEIGFVCVATPSGFMRKDRTATEYRLTEYACDASGELPTKDFMKWRPDEKTTVSPEGQTVSPEGQLPPRKAAKYA